MGEKFLKDQAKAFRHREDASYSVLTEPSLLTHCKAEEYRLAYSCQPLGDQGPAKGTPVWVRVVGDIVQVNDGPKTIGEIRGDDGQRLIRVLAGGPSQGMEAAEVDSVSPLGDFTIILKPEANGGDEK
jgi:hypothetical protein